VSAPEPVWGSLIAVLGGAAVGMERQRSGHAEAHLGGIRTLALLGGAAGIAGYLWRLGFAGAAVVLLGGCVAIVVTGYLAASRLDLDATTEAATLVVVAAGFVAGLGSWALSSGIIALTALLLVEKTKLHAWSEKIPEEAFRASFRFAVMALVVLPLLPEGPFGGGVGFRPRELWIVVLLLSGISFLGFAAHCVWGVGRGAMVSGLLGGLVSSTNTTLAFSRKSRGDAKAHAGLALGAVAASTVMFARVLVVGAVLEPKLSLAALRYLMPPLAVGALLVSLGLRRHAQESGEVEAPRNPLEVGAALQMAALFQAVLLGLDYVRGVWGEGGLVASAAVLGLTDVDALTMSMARGAKANAAQASLALAVGCAANTAFKGGIALALGQGEYRRWAALGLAALLGATLLGICCVS
jgi:uncharacterized membrane protein (DUF4010 family)